MPVRGYYAGASLGFGMMLAVANVLAGCAMTAVSSIILLDQVNQMHGLTAAGAVLLVAGICVLATGIFSLWASCGDRSIVMNISLYVSVCALLIAGVAAIMAIGQTGGIPKKTRMVWQNSKIDERQLIEETFACCGLNDLDEGSKDCFIEEICAGPLIESLKGRLRLMMIMGTVGCILQLGAMFCGWCVFEKMREHEAKQRRKQGITLMEAATGNHEHKTKWDIRREKKAQKLAEKQAKHAK